MRKRQRERERVGKDKVLWPKIQYQDQDDIRGSWGRKVLYEFIYCTGSLQSSGSNYRKIRFYLSVVRTIPKKILTDNLNQMTQILRKHRAITIVSQACYSYASLHHYFPLPKTSHPQHAMYPCLRVVGPTNWRNPMKSVSCLTQSWVGSI